MDQLLYRYSLCIALPLLLFFGFHMLFARVPEKKIFLNFLLSRRIMGAALLVLTINYSVHLICAPRFKDINATILINLSTYYLCYWLFSSALMTLLNNRYISRRRVLQHLAMWAVYVLLSACMLAWLPRGDAQHLGLIALAVWLVIYGLFLSIRLLRAYAKALKVFRDSHSDDIGAYIRWLSIFTIWAIVFGVSCSALTFLPDKYVFLWVLSAIPFYIYLYCSYQNYMLFYEKVENALIEEAATMPQEDNNAADFAADFAAADNNEPIYHTDIAQHIDEWINNQGYLKQGLTLNELSTTLHTNRTYLSAYINNVLHMSFRDWISDLRIEHAKQMMTQNPQMKIQEVSDSSGFLSLSHFSRTFSDKEGCTPARWRKSQAV
ncbi:MAG: helix-turn-helix domain-containing protein [Muribaculaceae bacterium]